MQTPSIHGWYAKESQTMVIICKYPRHVYQMVVWEITTNNVRRGQWLRYRKNLKLNRCALSPDGSLFAYFMFSEGHDTLTVLSKPPFFTGLYAQHEEGTWTGGAHFETPTKIYMKPRPQSCVEINNLHKDIVIIDPCPNSRVGTAWRDERVITPTNSKMIIDGKVVEVRDGKLFSNNTLIADFTKDTFQNVVAPYMRSFKSPILV